MKVNKDISRASTSGCLKNANAVALGALGGAAGTGEKKRRSREHYQRASAIRWEKVRDQKAQ